jgi:hypothetical protein
MKKVMFSLLMLTILASCSSKKWDKNYAATMCKDELKKQTTVTPDQVNKICDCAAEKLTTQYKSESAANKDENGVKTIFTDCTLNVVMPGTK